MSLSRTALVTGAGRGIGRASVEALADAGWQDELAGFLPLDWPRRPGAPSA